jgi:hypothetical protein
MDNYSKKILKRKITRLIRRGALKDKRIVLFGASVFSKEIKNCLTEKGYSVDMIIDNDSRKVGTVCMGLNVKKPDDAVLPYNDSFVFLILSGGFYREMTYQLMQMGYKRGRNIFILNFKTNETLSVFSLMLVRVMKGLYTYKKLIKNSQEKRTIFIAPYTGTGDIFLSGLFIKEYIKQKAITDYVLVVVSGACKRVAEIFDIKNIVVLKPTNTDEIISSRSFFRADWPIVVLNDGWLGEPSQWIRGYKGLNFERVFRYFVFGFDGSVPHEPPPYKDYGREVDALFEKYGLIKGRTVVLSPYSNTLFDLSDDVLERIVKHCMDSGFSVCTNCAGAEKPVKGTKAVFFPLNQAIEFMDAAGFFIGVRSGLCDVISPSKCKKVILYEKEGFFYKCSPYEYFSLEKMGLCDDAVEIEYHDDLKEECLREIFSALS